MRARMGLAYSQISYEHREILLRDRPQSLYDISPKGTVPVLQLDKGIVIDESIDIMKWALNQNDPENWYNEQKSIQDELIKINDNGEIIWEKTFGKYGEDAGFCVIPTLDSGFIITGKSNSLENNNENLFDLWILKTDPNGYSKFD